MTQHPRDLNQARLGPQMQLMLDQCTTISEQVALLDRTATHLEQQTARVVAVLRALADKRTAELPDDIAWPADDNHECSQDADTVFSDEVAA